MGGSVTGRFHCNQLLVYYVNTHTKQIKYFVNILGRVHFVITLCPKLYSGSAAHVHTFVVTLIALTVKRDGCTRNLKIVHHIQSDFIVACAVTSKLN